MIYVADTSALMVLRNYYPATFPSLWQEIDAMVANKLIASVEEVYKECDRRNDSDHLREWIERNRNLFTPPAEDEMRFVARIFAVPHFQQLVSQDALLRGGLAADPWVIARAHSMDGTVVTEERLKPQAAKIPNVCEHFGIPCKNVEGLLRDMELTY